MSFHFLNGITYFSSTTDTGPGTIIVDPFARIVAVPSTNALTLLDGAWDIVVSGTVFSGSETAIALTTPGSFVSNIMIKNGADIFGGVDGIFAAHATNITNAGRFTAKNNLAGIAEIGDGDFTIKNLKTGVIEGGDLGITILGLGTHAISNAGKIAVYTTDILFGIAAISGSGGIENVTNWGVIQGNALLGGGSDAFTNFKKVGGIIKQGTVTGVIDLGPGDDIFNGGKKAETVFDQSGTDIYKLGGGNDTYRAVYTSVSPSGDGADVVNGGRGFDTFNASGLVGGFVTVNLDTIAHFNIAAQSAKLSAGGSSLGTDTIIGFEKVFGSGGFDVLVGSNAADTFEAGAGQDTIFGLGGADFLTGGADNDSFLYTSLKDSGPTKATRDFIADFSTADDLIDLQSINEALNDNFHFVGNDVAFDGTPGAIIAVDGSDEKTIVKLDVNGDKVADFSIGFSELLTFAASDFQL